MATIVNISLIVIALSLLVLIFSFICLLREVRSLACNLKEFLDRAQRDLSPTISNLTATSTYLKEMSSRAGEGISMVSDLLVAVGEGAETIRRMNAILRALLPSGAIGAASFVVGVKSGLGVLLEQLLRRRKGK
jgi:hypothetical protein